MFERGKQSDSENAYVHLCGYVRMVFIGQRALSALCWCLYINAFMVILQGTAARAVWPTSPSPLVRWVVSTATWSAGLGWRLRRPPVRTLSPAPTCLPVTPSTRSDKVWHHGRMCVLFHSSWVSRNIGETVWKKKEFTESRISVNRCNVPMQSLVDRQERL